VYTLKTKTTHHDTEFLSITANDNISDVYYIGLFPQTISKSFTDVFNC